MTLLPIFGGLVLGCIEAEFFKKIRVSQHLSSCTRFAHFFCIAPNAKFQQKTSLNREREGGEGIVFQATNLPTEYLLFNPISVKYYLKLQSYI